MIFVYFLMATQFQSTAQQRRVFVPPEFNDSIINNPTFIDFFNRQVDRYNINYYVENAHRLLALAIGYDEAEALDNFDLDCHEICFKIERATRNIQYVMREARYNPTFTFCQNFIRKEFNECNM